jgi:hypothetical protein
MNVDARPQLSEKFLLLRSRANFFNGEILFARMLALEQRGGNPNLVSHSDRHFAGRHSFSRTLNCYILPSNIVISKYI